MLRRFGLPLLAEGADSRRRNFHGDRARPVVDAAMVYQWVEGYRRAAAQRRDACARVAAKYQPKLSPFGYSLYNLMDVATTDLLRPFVVDAQ